QLVGPLIELDQRHSAVVVGCSSAQEHISGSKHEVVVCGAGEPDSGNRVDERVIPLSAKARWVKWGGWRFHIRDPVVGCPANRYRAKGRLQERKSIACII